MEIIQIIVLLAWQLVRFDWVWVCHVVDRCGLKSLTCDVHRVDSGYEFLGASYSPLSSSYPHTPYICSLIISLLLNSKLIVFLHLSLLISMAKTILRYSRRFLMLKFRRGEGIGESGWCFLWRCTYLVIFYLFLK